MEGSTAPLGQGKKCTGMSLSERAELLALGTAPGGHGRGARQPRPGGARTDPNRPRAAELGTVLRSYPAEGHHRPAHTTAAWLSPKSAFLLPPRGCISPTPPAAAPPDRAPQSAAQGNARRVDTARSEALKSD